MAVMDGGATEKPNGGVLSSPPPSVVDEQTKQDSTIGLSSSEGGISHRQVREDVTLFGAFNRLIESIFDPNPHHDSTTAPPPMVNRIKDSVMEAAPLFREAILNTRREVLLWTRRGSPLRALLVVSVGTVALLALTGILVFMLFFVAATVNAIVISLLISLAAAGGFLAIFFSCLTTIYIVALCIAAFVTFTVTISLIIAGLVAAGWIGFLWIMWLVVAKSVTLAKRSLNIAGHALPANVSGQHDSHCVKEPGEVSN